MFVEHKANRLEFCQDFIGRLEIETEYFLDKVIRGAELKVFDYDSENTHRSAE